MNWHGWARQNLQGNLRSQAHSLLKQNQQRGAFGVLYGKVLPRVAKFLMVGLGLLVCRVSSEKEEVDVVFRRAMQAGTCQASLPLSPTPLDC